MIELLALPKFRVTCSRQHCPAKVTVQCERGDVWLKAGLLGWEHFEGIDLCPTHQSPYVPQGCRLETYAELPHDWQVIRWGRYACRHTADRKRCGHKAVLEMRKPHGAGYRWWAYCTEHAFGRWVQGDRVYAWHIERTYGGMATG